MLFGVVAVLACALGLGVAQAASGELDPTFNTTGKIVLPTAGNDTANDVVLQPDGKIVAVGFDASLSKMAVWRYTSDGVLDPAFNAAGGLPGVLELDIG